MYLRRLDHELLAQKQVFIHDSAEVEDLAGVGEGTKIWRWTHVREGAQIGRNCVIGQSCYIDRNVIIGDHVHLQNGIYIYEGVEIDDFVFVGPNVSFTNDLYPRAANEDWRLTPTRICYGSSVGAGAVIICGVTIGEFAMVGAGSTVTKNVLPNTLVAGNPARFRGFVKEYLCGMGPRDDRREPADFFDSLATDFRAQELCVDGTFLLGRISECPGLPISGSVDIFLAAEDRVIFRAVDLPDEANEISLRELDKATQGRIVDLLCQHLCFPDLRGGEK